MTQLASDNFTRANSGSLGANWTTNTFDSSQQFAIIGNTAQPDSLFSDLSDAYSAWSGGNDHYSEVTFNATAADGAGTGSGANCREITTAATYYRLIGNASGYELIKKVAGTVTSLSSGTGTTFAANDVLRLELQGTTWRLKKNGTQFATSTDSSISTGVPGVGYSSTASSQANAALKLWAGGDFALLPLGAQQLT